MISEFMHMDMTEKAAFESTCDVACELTLALFFTCPLVARSKQGRVFKVVLRITMLPALSGGHIWATTFVRHRLRTLLVA